MAKVVKKKLKLKKKNFTLFVIFIILCIFSLTSTTNLIINALKEDNSKDKNNKKPLITENKQEKKNEFEKIEFYKEENKERYKEYQKENSDLTPKEIVTHVNIGIDNNYYENTKETKYLNQSYILVNKYNYLPEDYVPENLKEINKKYSTGGMKLVDYAKEAFEKMAIDAKKENLSIIAMSSYRSYTYQVNLYNRYKEQDGEETADTYSARAGFSEHQTGLTVDVYNGKKDYTEFENTKEFTWMQENAHNYGFILRFPKDKTKLTGYQYESWHYRYVGKEIATYIKEKNICFEEYYIEKLDN